MSLTDIRDCLGAVGDLFEAEQAQVGRVVIDSRQVQEGDLFVCLPGQTYDGHQFAAQAVDGGALAVLASRPLPELAGAPVLLVTDTQAALGRLASCWRGQTRAKVAAVTGSAGKTTLKELLAAALARRFEVAKNYKNFNNLIGVPLTMLQTSGAEDVWVLELGVSVPGEMEQLAAMTRPDLAIIHNVGPAHLDGFGDVAGVARAKCKLLEALAPGSTAIVSRDYPELLAAARAILPPEGAEESFMSLSTRDPHAPLFCRMLGSESGGGRFELRTPWGDREVLLPWRAAYLAENLAAAVGAACLLGMDLDAALAGLAAAQAVEQRFVAQELGPYLLVDDTYNANPLSMQRAIECAGELAARQPLTLVLGDMRELGSEAHAAHEAVGRAAGRAGTEAVYYRGQHAPEVRVGLAEAGSRAPLIEVASADEFLAAWAEQAPAGGVVLFKGSRSMRMEELVRALAERLHSGDDA